MDDDSFFGNAKKTGDSKLSTNALTHLSIRDAIALTIANLRRPHHYERGVFIVSPKDYEEGVKHYGSEEAYQAAMLPFVPLVKVYDDE